MTREEAIKEIKSWAIPSERGREVLETLIPELVESEDEKIRKELIEFIQWSEDRGMTRHDFHQAKRPSEWIDYLEKQKEPHYTKRNALFDKCVENCDPAVMKKVSDEIDEMLRKEQKPAEWSEEDESTLKEIISFFKDGTVKLQHDLDLYAGFLEKRLKFLRPQSKVEWSDKDKYMFEKINGSLNGLKKYVNEHPSMSQAYKESVIKDIEQQQDWFKSLKPSWRPSAQELGALKTAVSVLTEERTFPKAAEQIQKIIDVFDGKELRKDWKPSEEQMKALDKAIPVCIGVVGRDEIAPLESLYEQLKKL